jgi:hypothetical protein
MWIRGELRINNINGNYQIVFEGVSGKYSLGVSNVNNFLHEAFYILTNEMKRLLHWTTYASCLLAQLKPRDSAILKVVTFVITLQV